MKYDQLEKHTAKPATNIIESQNKKLTELINNTGKFWHGWAGKKPKDKILVTYSGYILICINGEYYIFQRLQVVQQWERLDIESGEKIIVSSITLLKELIAEIGINRIHGEDYGNGFYKNIHHDNLMKLDEAYCYVNPDIPNGYWKQNTLRPYTRSS